MSSAFTGLRQGELFALRWRDVDLVVGLVHVRPNYTGKALKVPKGKKARSVPATPEVVDALARLKERDYFTGADDLVFCSVLGGFCATASGRWPSPCSMGTRSSRT